MPHNVGPERAHFGGADGLISETQGGITSYFWKCMHCGWKLGGKNFQNVKARIHLSGDTSLRNGIISQVCTKASVEIQKQFVLLEKCKRLEKNQKAQARKRSQELLQISPVVIPTKRIKLQKKLSFAKHLLPANVVDEAWGQCFFGLDIAIAIMMANTTPDSLEDKICTAWTNRAPELESDISNAAWVIDPQFVSKSRKAGPDIMRSFWSVTRKVLKVSDETSWRSMRSKMVDELAKFRMKTGGFAFENYSVEDTSSFWSVAGCHAPNLRQVAMCLAPLPCSSGEAERNWFEVKTNKTKVRNKLGKKTLAKMIFVRRFIRLKRKVVMNQSCDAFKKWVSVLLQNIVEANNGSTSSSSGDDSDGGGVFCDIIEEGEQGRINGCESGKSEVTLTSLKKNHAAKSWLFEKYYNMAFVDKNPEGGADDPPLEQAEWEHRVIKDVVWWRRKGWCVKTCLRGTVSHQSIVNYQINSSLHRMIRDSPHNLCTMFTAQDSASADTDDSNESNEGLFDTESGNDSA